MRAREMSCFAAGAMLAAAAVFGDEVTIVSNVLGPEGPLYVDGNLYYVGWISSTLSKWDGKTNIVLNCAVGCGHNGLALTKHKTLLLACDDEHGAILELDMSGKELRRWEVDSTGQKFDGGINDIVVTANGGAYATLSGPFVNPPVAVMGKIGRGAIAPAMIPSVPAGLVSPSPVAKSMITDPTAAGFNDEFTE